MIDSPYLWLKALHIIAVIAWMAGQLYLPRLYVYHAEQRPGSETANLLKVMELRLLRYIMNPAMIVTYVFGLWLAFKINAFDPTQGLWLHIKVTLVIALSASHGMMSRWRKRFAHDEIPHSARFFRIFNEIQTLLLVLIVFLVVIKPF